LALSPALSCHRGYRADQPSSAAVRQARVKGQRFSVVASVIASTSSSTRNPTHTPAATHQLAEKLVELVKAWVRDHPFSDQ
jgi:hypothetical protein